MSSYYQNLCERRDDLRAELQQAYEDGDTYGISSILDRLNEIDDEIGEAEKQRADDY